LQLFSLPVLFIVFALPTCIFLSLSVPTGEVVDEGAHVIRAGSLLHGDILGHRMSWRDTDGNVIRGAGVTANPALLAADQSFPQGTPTAHKKLTAATLDQLHNIAWAPAAGLIYAPNTAVYMPIFYIPAALGLGLSHILQLGPHAAILLARLSSAACFLSLALIALMIAERGRTVLFAALSLPMTLSLAASCNQDGMLIATSALAASLLTRCKTPGGWPYWSSAVALAAVIATKPAYLPLAAMMLVPVTFRWRAGVRGFMPIRAIVALLLTTLPALLWAAIAMSYVAAPFVRGPAYHPGPLWPGDPNRLFHATDPAAQLLVFLHNPLRLLSLPFSGLYDESAFRVRELVGVLGWIEFLLPPRLYQLWYWAIPLAFLADVAKPQGSREAPGWFNNLLVAVAIIASVFALYDVQYLSWTPVGAAAVDGVQGRYGIPILAFLSVVAGSQGNTFARISRGLSGLLAMPAVAAAAVGLVVLPQIIVLTYYLQ
jgi:hypothetical protein